MVQIAYLIGNTIRVASISQGTSNTIVETTWDLPRGEKREDYAGLTCGRRGQLAAHATSLISDPEPRQVSQIVSLDLERRVVRPVLQDHAAKLSWPVWSPDGKHIAATASIDGRDLVAAISLDTNAVRVYESDRNLSPHAWAPGERTILATGTNPSEASWEAVSVDLMSGASSKLGPGGRPLSRGTPPESGGARARARGNSPSRERSDGKASSGNLSGPCLLDQRRDDCGD